MTSGTYVTCGLTIRSDIELPTSAAPADTPVDIELVLEPGPLTPGALVVERRIVAEDPPYLRVFRAAGGYLLDHADGIVLEVTEGGRRVAIRHLSPSLDEAHRSHILLDQLLPLVFAHLGRLSFHGSAVALDRRALCFLAESKTGKSTAAAALVRHAAARFLADDEVVLEEKPTGFEVHPSYPSVRLWNESASVLFDTQRKERGKHHVVLPASAEAVPLAAVVLLDRAPVDQAAPVEVDTLTPRNGVVGVATHLDRLDPTDRVALRRELEALSRLAERTTIVRMRIARNLDRLPEAAIALREWSQQLPLPSQPERELTQGDAAR